MKLILPEWMAEDLVLGVSHSYTHNLHKLRLFRRWASFSWQVYCELDPLLDTFVDNYYEQGDSRS